MKTTLTYLLGRFPFRTPNFWKFLVTNETAFSVIPGKEDNLVRFTEIFGNNAENFHSIWFPLGISEIFGWTVRLSEIQQFSYFSG